MKAISAAEVRIFTDIPNVGPRMADDFKRLGIRSPQDLSSKDPYEMYKKIGALDTIRHDPCVLDTYMAVVDFMKGGETKPWWMYTSERKQMYPNL